MKRNNQPRTISLHIVLKFPVNGTCFQAEEVSANVGGKVNKKRESILSSSYSLCIINNNRVAATIMLC